MVNTVQDNERAGEKMVGTEAVARAKEHFSSLMTAQLSRLEAMKAEGDWIDYGRVKPLIIGIVGGDGIGPAICMQAERVLRFLLQAEVEDGRVEFRVIEGLTLANRVAAKKTLPYAVLKAIRACHVILKGPTTTPKRGDPWPNLESANVAMRKELDLFANVRPVKIPSQGVDWTFFRENTEGAYALGSSGINVTEDLAVDFKVTTTQGSERILRLAFEYAQKTGLNRVTVVTKANVVKTTDGKFLEVAKQVAAAYPEVEWDDWFIDIMTAKLVDPLRRAQFKVIVLPNLYGDIITDEAAQLQGGVGTAGSANIGKRYAMFEAIHGSAPRMVQEGRAQYADPSSIIRAAVMLLKHIGYGERAERLEMALDVCGVYERKVGITGRSNGASGAAFADYVMATIQDPNLERKWLSYSKTKTA
jgi:isocitrate dehydrogenase (NAD+)